MYLKEVGWEVEDWIDMAWDKDQWQTLANTVMNRWVPSKAGNFLTT
jgi:hypothetical protein